MHFTHNAEFICEYPNLPASLTRAKVYAAWLAITSVGAIGFLLIRRRYAAAGLLFVAAYAALGFDGLGHYAVAPMALHTFMSNVTILSEVAAAALLLLVTLYLLASRLFPRPCGMNFPKALRAATLLLTLTAAPAGAQQNLPANA